MRSLLLPVILLLFFAALMCQVSAEGPYTQNTPVMADELSRATTPHQPGQQSTGQNPGQSPPFQTVPGTTGLQFTGLQQGKGGNAVQNTGKNPGVPMGQEPSGPRQSGAGLSSQYRSITFPQSYPDFRPDNGVIQVTSSPTGASVYLDGDYRGITPSSGYLDLTDLSPGTYTLRLTCNGYLDYTTVISLSRNQVATVSADLTSEYFPSGYGALLIRSAPSGADVYLDNEYKGITPIRLQGVTAGLHTAFITKDGYSAYSGDVNIVSDQASGLSVTLTENPSWG